MADLPVYNLERVIGRDELGKPRSYLVSDIGGKKYFARSPLAKTKDGFAEEKEIYDRLNGIESHPRIQKCRGPGLVKNGRLQRPFLIFDYYEGNNLDNSVGRCSTGFVYGLVKDMLGILGFLYDRKISHTDINPRKIIMSRQLNREFPTLTGFGYGKDASKGLKDIHQVDKDGRGMQGMSLTPYTSFEGIFGKVGPNSDVYSLGVLAYNLLRSSEDHIEFPAQMLVAEGIFEASASQREKYRQSLIKNIGDFPALDPMSVDFLVERKPDITGTPNLLKVMKQMLELDHDKRMSPQELLKVLSGK